MKASILAALILWALPAAAQTNNPIVPPPGVENQIWRQQQIEDFVRDRDFYDLSQQQQIARLQEQIDGAASRLDNADVASGRELSRLQLELSRLQYAQQLQRLDANRRIFMIDHQGDTARRRRWAAQFAREQQAERFAQQQRLAGIAQDLARFGGE
ncbi:MAG TPA: hypothetical protein VGH50_05885 [Candidatus Binatia bacterium]|jgi:hypothetical protein